jgi:DNA-binding NarL/FixJ family response regulator
VGAVLARIFLADDNPALRRLLRGLIEAHAGWQICGEATDGLDAVTKAIDLAPDLVVVDFAMPSLNGLQVAEKVCSVYPRLPMILHTVHLFPAMIDEAKKAGIREVVGKGVTAERLLDVIERLLEGNRAGASRTAGSKTDAFAAWAENGDGKPPGLN